MKSHLRVSFMNKKQHEEAVKVGNEAFRQKGAEHTRRILKIVSIALNEKFGFGAGRLGEFLNEVAKISNEHMDDELFWRHADIRLKQMGVPFSDENYEEFEK